MSSTTLPVCPKTGSTSPSLTVHLCLHTALLREIGNAPLETELAAIATVEEKATKFLDVFIRKSVSKGRFAQELAGILAECNLGANAVPDYISNALRHLGVLNEAANDGHG